MEARQEDYRQRRQGNRESSGIQKTETVIYAAREPSVLNSAWHCPGLWLNGITFNQLLKPERELQIMRFDEAFIEKLPTHPYHAAQVIFAEFEDLCNEHNSLKERVAVYGNFLRALTVLEAICEINDIEMSKSEVPVNKSDATNTIISIYNDVRAKFDAIQKDVNLEELRARFAIKFASAFAFEFSDGDLKRVQTLVNELRDIITSTEELEEDHKRRLLRRLEKLQSELHKRMSDLDRFWGLVGDAGIVMAKLGQDAKPIVDRIREIAEIVWCVQGKAAQLPSNTPLQLITADQEKPEAASNS